jgi:hypothetical protein
VLPVFDWSRLRTLWLAWKFTLRLTLGLCAKGKSECSHQAKNPRVIERNPANHPRLSAQAFGYRTDPRRASDLESGRRRAMRRRQACAERENPTDLVDYRSMEMLTTVLPPTKGLV